MIHQFQNNGYNIVLDVNSGSVHVMDGLAYEAIGKLDEALGQNKKAESSDISQAFIENILGKSDLTKEIFQLVEAGRLFTPDTYEDYISQVKEHKTVVKALCLHVAHDCNLACKYCFAEEGEYHGKRELMPLEVGKRALDFLIAHSGNRRNLEVDFFGGEPLLNWAVVKDIVAYGRAQEKIFDKNFRFTLTTNGVLLNDEVIDFANIEMDNVVISLDGRKEINDNMRPFPKGKGSYDIILPKVQKLAKSRTQAEKDYYVRGTFTRDNLEFSKDVLHFADLGLKEVSLEPVVAEANEAYALKESDLPTIYKEYDSLAQIMTKREFNFFHFLLDLEGGPCVAKRLSGCGAGTEYLAVSPTGDLYPCHQFVGKDKFYLGNVDEGVIKPEIPADFRSCSIYNKEACRSCFAKFYCSGGCMANSQQFKGNIHDIYELGCEMEKKRVECALMLKVDQMMKVGKETHE